LDNLGLAVSTLIEPWLDGEVAVLSLDDTLVRLPAGCNLTSRLDVDARLYDPPAVRQPRTPGRPRKRSPRRPTPRQMLTQRTRRPSLNIYGRRDRLPVAEQVARMHAVPDRPLRIVAVD